MPLILALVPLAFFRVAGFLGCPASHSARKPRNDSRGSGIAIMSFQTALKRLRAITPPPKTGKDFLQLFLALATCFLAGILGLKLTILNPPVSPVWPPAGVGLAAMLLLDTAFGRRFSLPHFLCARWPPRPCMPPRRFRWLTHSKP